MKWKKLSNYCMTNGTHNICKIIIGGVVTYELWKAGGERLGIYSSFDEAKGKISE